VLTQPSLGSATSRRQQELRDAHFAMRLSLGFGLASEAHGIATILEERLPAELGMPAEVITHLESLEDHADVHREQYYTGKPE
jgi:hypothetical protein